MTAGAHRAVTFAHRDEAIFAGGKGRAASDTLETKRDGLEGARGAPKTRAADRQGAGLVASNETNTRPQEAAREEANMNTTRIKGVHKDTTPEQDTASAAELAELASLPGADRVMRWASKQPAAVVRALVRELRSKSTA